MKYPPVQMALVILVGPVFWACAAATRAAQHPGSVGASSPSSLYKEISKVDSALSTAFNAHDLNALMSLFTEDLEFYHDAGGLQSYTQVRTDSAVSFLRTTEYVEKWWRERLRSIRSEDTAQ